jgi:ferredoxin/uncharacterized FlaG/YvyC family protein
MRVLIPVLCFLVSSTAAFHPTVQHSNRWIGWKSLTTTRTALRATVSTAEDEQKLNQELETIAHKLRLQVYDVDTGVYGFDSKDPLYGIENIHTRVHIDPTIGLELTEVAHGNAEAGDHRGLVLVSSVTSNALHETPIHVGDTIVGVFAGAEFKESCTGVDYDSTIDVINRAKEYCSEHDLSTIVLELNRLVKKARVAVQVEDESGNVMAKIDDALAGDNLRLLLMHHHINLYGDHTIHRLDQPTLTGDCGGEGICGTCMVNILEGMEHLNKIGPQESSLLHFRPSTWRAACKTVIAADNQEGTKLRVQLQPYNVKHSSGDDPSNKLKP